MPHFALLQSFFGNTTLGEHLCQQSNYDNLALALTLGFYALLSLPLFLFFINKHEDNTYKRTSELNDQWVSKYVQIIFFSCSHNCDIAKLKFLQIKVPKHRTPATRGPLARLAAALGPRVCLTAALGPLLSLFNQT